MSLLTMTTRKKYFEALGLEYDKEGIKKFQRVAFTDPDEIDGKYGPHTDAALRHWYNVKKHTKNFTPEEFRCPCGKCTGYPTHMKANELKNIQAIRDHFGRPMIITSALRCPAWNKAVKGDGHSRHLEGRAVDFYMERVTTTLSRRKEAIRWMRGLPKFHYAYCNGYNSYGQNVRRISMGNAIHIDSDA